MFCLLSSCTPSGGVRLCCTRSWWSKIITPVTSRYSSKHSGAISSCLGLFCTVFRKYCSECSLYLRFLSSTTEGCEATGLRIDLCSWFISTVTSEFEDCGCIAVEQLSDLGCTFALAFGFHRCRRQHKHIVIYTSTAATLEVFKPLQGRGFVKLLSNHCTVLEAFSQIYAVTVVSFRKAQYWRGLSYLQMYIESRLVSRGKYCRWICADKGSLRQ